jgi:hypothetical protein
VPERHVERIERKLGVQRAGYLPAHHIAREDVDDEGDVDPSTVGLHIGQVGDPEAVGRGGAELPRHQVSGTCAEFIAERGPHAALAAHHPAEPEPTHEALDGAARHADPLAVELGPHLVGAIHAAVLGPDALDGGLELRVPDLADRPRAGARRVIGGGSNLQEAADRLDSPAGAVGVDEAHRGGSCGSSSRAKKTEAAFRISLARRSSRFSRSNSCIRCRSVLVSPGRSPLSTSARRTHNRRVSAFMPSLSAIDEIAAHSEGYSLRCSPTIRTARSCNS